MLLKKIMIYLLLLNEKFNNEINIINDDVLKISEDKISKKN